MKYNIATSFEGNEVVNRISLCRQQVVVALHADFDCDPEQDDEVRLKSYCERYMYVLRASDHRVKYNKQTNLLDYYFTDIPPSFYIIEVCVAGQWIPILSDLVITARAIYIKGNRVPERQPFRIFHNRDSAIPKKLMHELKGSDPSYMDINEAFKVNDAY